MTPRLSIAALVAVACILSTCQAGRFLCTPNAQRKINIEREPRLEDFIVLEFDNDKRNGISTATPASAADCTCEVSLYKYNGKPRQVMLEAVHRNYLSDDQTKKPSKSQDSNSNETIQLSWIEQRKSSGSEVTTEELTATVTLQTLKVISMSSTVTVKMHSVIAQSAIALRIAPIDEGYCAWDMAYYRQSCFYYGTKSVTLNEALDLIDQGSTGAMQLASFSSLEDIRQFIGSNKAPIGEFPIKKPIDLTNPVRIGWFYTGAGEIMSTLPGNCEILEPIGNSREILSISGNIRGQCGSLKVSESGSPVIEFMDCSHRMPALISFPESPRVDCVNCATRIREFMRSSFTTEKNHKKISKIVPVITVSASSVLLVTLIVLVIYITVVRRRMMLRYGFPPSSATVLTNSRQSGNSSHLQLSAEILGGQISTGDSWQAHHGDSGLCKVPVEEDMQSVQHLLLAREIGCSYKNEGQLRWLSDLNWNQI